MSTRGEREKRDERGAGWNGELLDLEAYLARIGYAGPREPNLDVLRALQRAHVTSLPFENIDAVGRRPVPLGVEAVQDKMVRRRRGGYCYEHVTLFAAALERFGFPFTALHARITLGSDKILPATHAVLVVTVPGVPRQWLCDVGFGGGPLGPLELADGAEADFEGWRFRMEWSAADGAEQWWLHQYGTGGWVDRHTFTLTPQFPIDYVVGGHYVSTHPRSPFTTRLFAQRFSAERHLQIDGSTLSTTLPDGTRTERAIEPERLRAVLRDEFGIVIDDADADRLDTAARVFEDTKAATPA